VTANGEARTCLDCRFSVQEDYGYSNYTTEGTEFSCAKRLHPDGAFDRWYGEAPRLLFAQQCAGFEAGDGIEVDTEREAEPREGDPEWEVWQMHLAADGRGGIS